MLEQPETKQAAVQMKYFLGGQQEKIEDVFATIDKKNIFHVLCFHLT